VAFSSQPIPPGERVCIVTNPGGPAIIGVDECMAAGLKLAELSPETKDSLKKIVFQEATVSNPVDVVATAGPDQYGGTVAALLDDPNIDSLLLVFVTAPFVDCEGIARKLGELGKTSPKPIVCQVITIEKWQEVIRLIRESGIPVYDFAEAAAKSLSAMTRYGAFLRKETPVYEKCECDKDDVGGILGNFSGKGMFLPQADVFDILGSYGIPCVETVKIKEKSELEKAADKIGYPVVLKVDAEEIVHKTESGGVKLDIKDITALLSEFEKMVEKFRIHKPNFILQKYEKDGKEVIIGAKKQSGIEPMVMFGLGGVFVETLKDVQFRLAPLTKNQAVDMIRSIKGFPILEGTRGEKGVDLDILVDILIRFSQLVLDFPEIDEFDLNPVLAFENRAVVVDARLKIKG
ncbi:MAG: acetate--CoA ligase family protein, partial [Candidatus Aminicenantes bacterium]|nr:acetate--CoA ligase family protein [Candidatus Aminicenantes bacterium]